MVAKLLSSHYLKNKDGQSVLEVVFVLPFLFLFVALLYKINSAIQMSVNNTQYARSQVYILTSNSPEYPRIKFRYFPPRGFAEMEQDRMVLGVADPANLTFEPGADIEPDPQTQKIGRLGTAVPGSESQGEVTNRTNIRIRNTAAICTQLNAVGKYPMVSDTATGILSLKSQRWPFNTEVCRYKGMSEG